MYNYHHIASIIVVIGRICNFLTFQTISHKLSVFHRNAIFSTAKSCDMMIVEKICSTVIVDKEGEGLSNIDISVGKFDQC
jgi:Ca2+/Na+ antiporter